MKKYILTLILIACGAGSARAVDSSTAPVKPKYWTVDLTGGYTMSRGNTETDHLASSAKANRKTYDNETTFEGNALYAASRGVMDAQAYTGSARYAYSFGERHNWYQFFKQEVQHDRFALIQLRSLTTTGVGYWWSDNDDFRMMAELGAGVEHTEYERERHRTNQGVAIPRFFVEKRIAGRSKLSEDFSMVWGSQERVNGHQMLSITKFTNPISRRVSLEVSLTDKYSSRPPADAKKNDVMMMTSLHFSY